MGRYFLQAYQVLLKGKIIFHSTLNDPIKPRLTHKQQSIYQKSIIYLNFQYLWYQNIL